MKILSCTVHGFGKLREYRTAFGEGENELIRENGFGKSTLAAFFCAMFYGLSGDKARKDYASQERRRYKPWDGGIFGGEICFSVGDKKYRLNRSFGEKAAQDTFDLREMLSNLPSSDYTENIGLEMFGMDRTSFRNTVFFGQEEHVEEMTDDMYRLLGNDEASDGGKLQASEILKTEINGLSPKRATGKVCQLRERMQEIMAERKNEAELRSERDDKQETIGKKRKRVDEIDAQKAEGNEQLNALLALVRNAGEGSVRMERLKRLREKEDAYDDALDAFPGEVFTETEMDAYSKEGGRLLYAKEELSKLTLSEEEERLISSDSERKHALAKAKQIKYMLLGIGGFFGILLCGLAWTFNYWFTSEHWIPFMLGCVAIILLLVVINIGIKKNKKRIIELSNDNGSLFDKKAKYEELKDRVNRSEQDLRKRLTERGIVLNEDTCADIQNLQLLWNRVTRSKAEMEKELNAYTNAYQVDPSQETEQSILEYMKSVEEANRKISDLQERMSSLDDEKSALSKEISDLEIGVRNLNQRLEELDGLREEGLRLETECEELTKRYHLLVKTQELIERAAHERMLRYTKPIMEHFQKYYLAITENTREFHMDANAKLTVVEQGKQRELATQSSGYRDLILFAKRLAFADTMFPAEKPFLILDDPFVNLDEKHMEAAKKLLSVLSEQYQVFYFSARS